MNLQKLTIKAQEALQQAQQFAQEHSHGQIENEHVFQGILSVDEHIVSFLLKKLGVNEPLLKQVLEKELQSKSKVSGGELSMSPETGKTINEALISA